MAASTPSPTGGLLGRVLTVIERVGNKLPDPVFLFISATLIVMGLSWIGSSADWQVQPQRPRVVMQTVVENGVEVQRARHDEAGRPVVELVDAGSPVRARNLVSSDGFYWLISNMVRNFINFAPLGVVLVSMFGIGVAEKVGLFGAFMKYMASIVPTRLLTPMVVFLGVMSNTASDAGYIILPPLAGIVAAFAGVSGGFSANLLIASTDTLVAPLTQNGARVLDAGYVVNPACNWWFLAASTFLLTFAGWAVTAWVVEPRLVAARSGDAGDGAAESQELGPTERRGLRAALVALVVTVAGIAAVLTVPGAPLHGTMPAPAPLYGPIPVAQGAPEAVFEGPGSAGVVSVPADGSAAIKPGLSVPALTGSGQRGTFRSSEAVTAPGRFTPAPAAQPRWSQAIVPIILVGFLVPGLAYGMVTGAIRTHKDISKAFIHSMQTMAPIVTMAFFAAQFIESFKYSQLDSMLANAGGKALFAAGLPRPLMLVAMILLVMVVNLMISSMSAKWTALSVILVPMMMMSGISPELTQAAYRVGDSVTNIVTPLNTYIIVILAAAQRYRKDLGIGNLIAMMLPYTAVFFVVWSLFLIVWVTVGWPLGPSGPLWYTPQAH